MKKVSNAKLHFSLFVPGVGSVGETLPPSNKTFRDLEMSYDDWGLHVKIQGAYVLVPPASVQVVRFSPEEK